MPSPPAVPLDRFAAAEARLHHSASALERISLDAVDEAVRAAAAPSAERIAQAVAAVTRRYRETHHEARHAR